MKFNSKNRILIKEKVIPIILVLIGFLLLYINIKSFISSIKFYEIYREQKGMFICFGGGNWFPFFEFATSILGSLFGLILIKKLNIFFKVMITFSLSFTIYYLLVSLIKVIYCLINDYSSTYKIFEIGGILFFTLLLSHYYKYDWRKEIKNLWYLKIIIFVLIILGIELLLTR